VTDYIGRGILSTLVFTAPCTLEDLAAAKELVKEAIFNSSVDVHFYGGGVRIEVRGVGDPLHIIRDYAIRV
jgi:hypothetical protein